MRRAMGLLCGVAMLLGSQGSAEAKGLTIGQLKALVKDLGYEATSDDKSYVSLPDQGKWGKNVFISLHDEGETLEVYSNFGELPDASKTVIPFADLLAANDDERFVFAIGRSDGKPSLFLEGQLAAATVNKQVLRKTIDSWLVRIDSTEPTWNSDHWAAAAPAASPAAAAATPPVAPVAPAAAAASPRKIFCDRSVEKDPLKLQNVSFRKGAMGEEGGDVARPSSVFGAEEPMYVELDVSGFLCSSLDKDRYQALFTIDQGIKGSDDPDFEPFGSMSQTLEFDTSKPVDLALLRVTLTPHWKTAGKYTFRYIVHDNIKGTEASTAIPFTIDLAKQAVK